MLQNDDFSIDNGPGNCTANADKQWILASWANFTAGHVRTAIMLISSNSF
jgi:hypothetical protein